MTKTPTAIEINEKLLATMRRQVATTRQGKAIIAAGLSEVLDELVIAMAGNASIVVELMLDPE